ncbi:hypothetical protein ACIRU3_21425 [Streptomyces sp. NPDC101151]|uniref:hypothetical protein n=1 Tax=Streptomyces sp. NPDC101151 TaxID=3366115 RepID=UPI00380D7376
MSFLRITVRHRPGPAPPAVATTRIPTASAAPDGSRLQLRARTSDGIDTSTWSGWKAFRIDATAVQPAVLSTQLVDEGLLRGQVLGVGVDRQDPAPPVRAVDRPV